MANNPHEEAVQAALQHDPEVTVYPRQTGYPFRAECSCGWQGALRSRQDHADDDISVHLRTVLPDDAPGSIYR